MLLESKPLHELLTSLLENIEEQDEDVVFPRLELSLQRLKKQGPPQQNLNIFAMKPSQLVKMEQPIQPFTSLNKLLSKIGKGFSLNETFFVQNSIQALSSKLGFAINFFGKVSGNEGDYFVSYAFIDNGRLAEQTIEQAEEALNSFKIFIAIASENFEWRALPKITRGMIRSSRKVRVVFEGNPSRNLSKLGFNGTEEQLLKCQIIRMLCSCAIAPKQSLKTEDLPNGGVKIIPDKEALAEYKMTIEDVSAPENLIHRFPYLRKEGAFSASFVRWENEQTEKLKAQIEEADPQIPPLRTISEDTPSFWKSRVVGERTLIGKAESVTHSIVVWEHSAWKGAFNLFDIANSKWHFFFFGFLEKTNFQLIPELKKEVQTVKIVDKKLQPEPNHWEEPKPVEPEAEKKADGEEGADGAQVDDQGNNKEGDKENGDSGENKVENE